MEKVNVVGVVVMVGLVLMVQAGEGARDLPNNNKKSGEMEHPEGIYGGVGGVGGVVPGVGGGFNPVVVSGGTTFNCPFPNIGPCTFVVHPVVPGGGPGIGVGGGGITNP